MTTTAKTHKLTENQKKVLRVLYPGAPRNKDHFLEVGVTQYIKGVRALVTRGMAIQYGPSDYRITPAGTAAIEEADGIKRSPEAVAADPPLIELAGVTHPLLEGKSETPDVTVTTEPVVIEPAAEPKKVSLSLVGLDGNAFNLMGKFAAQARKEGWSNAEIQDVLNDAMDGDYQHLLRVLASRCESPDTEPTREKVSVWEFWEQTPEGGRHWVAEVSKEEGDGAVLYTSPACPTADGAKYDALAWAEANKYEVV